jgi:hypothetical protein
MIMFKLIIAFCAVVLGAFLVDDAERDLRAHEPSVLPVDKGLVSDELVTDTVALVPIQRSDCFPSHSDGHR